MNGGDRESVVGFLLARLREDEATALAAITRSGSARATVTDELGARTSPVIIRIGCYGRSQPSVRWCVCGSTVSVHD